MAKGKTPAEIEWAIDQLQADRRIIGRCQYCGEENHMGDWLLFYGDSFPKDAAGLIKEMYEAPSKSKKEYIDLKRASTVESGRISVRVKVGQIVEQIVPGLPTFPYEKIDCRSLFKPIDYVIFEGLSKRLVRRIHFVDIKTGDAGTTPREKAVERIVSKKNVEFTRY